MAISSCGLSALESTCIYFGTELHAQWELWHGISHFRLHVVLFCSYDSAYSGDNSYGETAVISGWGGLRSGGKFEQKQS